MVAPSPSTESLIADVCDSSLTLHDIAAKHGLPLESITLWMAQPDVQERLNRIESAACEHIRAAATNQLSSVLAALGAILNDFTAAHSLPDSTPDHPTTPREQMFRFRHAEIARKAAGIIVRLSRHKPSARHAAPRQSPSRAAPPPADAPRADQGATSGPSLEELAHLLPLIMSELGHTPAPIGPPHTESSSLTDSTDETPAACTDTDAQMSTTPHDPADSPPPSDDDASPLGTQDAWP